jgi:hypothetical protein
MPCALDDDFMVDRQRIELCPNALKGRYVTITPAVQNLVGRQRIELCSED